MDEPAATAEAEIKSQPATAPSGASAQEQLESDLQRIRTATHFDGLLSLCCLFLRQHTAAKDAYVARNTNNQLQYICATPDSRMLGVTLTAPTEEGDDGESGVVGKGVSFDAWKATVPGPVNEDGEETTVAPKYILVDNVVRDKRVKLLGLPALGSYLAVPLNYSTCLHAEGLQMHTTVPEPKEEEEGPEVEPQPVTTWTKQTIPASLLFGLDTIGTGLKFSRKDIDLAIRVAEVCAESITRIEDELWTQQLEWKKAYDSNVEKLKNTYATALNNEPSGQEENANENKDASKEEEGGEGDAASRAAYREAAARMQHWGKACIGVQQNLARLQQHALPPVPLVLQTLTLVATLLGVAAEEMHDLHSNVSWDKLRKVNSCARGLRHVEECVCVNPHLALFALAAQLYNDKLISKIPGYDPAAVLTVTPATTCEALSSAVNELIFEKAAIADHFVPAAMLLEWARAALMARSAAIASAANEEDPRQLELLQA